jgi:hypothetical protein
MKMTDEKSKSERDVAKIIAKAWADEDFKARLIADPVAVLKAESMHVPEGLTLKVVENTKTLAHFVLPAKPDDCKSGERLDERQVGTAFCIACSYAD